MNETILKIDGLAGGLWRHQGGASGIDLEVNGAANWSP